MKDKKCDGRNKTIFLLSSLQIRWFWEVFHALPLEEKKKFLLFLTGSDRIPIEGMKAIKVSFVVVVVVGFHCEKFDYKFNRNIKH